MVRKNPKALLKGNLAEVIIKLETRMCLEIDSNNMQLSRIILRDGVENFEQNLGSETLAAGSVIKLLD